MDSPLNEINSLLTISASHSSNNANISMSNPVPENEIAVSDTTIDQLFSVN